MLFPTAWVFPVNDTGNAAYWSVVVPVPLSFYFNLVFFLPFLFPGGIFVGEEGGKGVLVLPWDEGSVGVLRRSGQWGTLLVPDQDPSWG